jgi:sulfhydrogenase subunit alpha
MPELVIAPLARVEGHGCITMKLKDNEVRSVRVDIYEGPRLIETLVKGKTPQENLNIVCRICAICSISHRYAALRGLEKALSIEPAHKVVLLRELMHLGEIIESNALHIFVLALPDFLGYPSAVAMVDKYRAEVLAGLELKRFGNRVTELLSGRMIHGENPILGGFGRYPNPEELDSLKEEAASLIPSSEAGVELLRSFQYPTFMEEGMLFMALKPSGDHYGFVGDKVLISTGEERDIEEYRELTQERVVAHSFAKRSRYKGRPFFVGALARMNILGERLNGRAAECFRRCYNLAWLRNPLYNNLAQALEILYCLERIPALIEEIQQFEDPPRAEPTRDAGSGTGAVEAPRGILYHHYELSRGLISSADIITPTAQNLDNLERHLRVGAVNLLSRGDKELELKLGMVARAYDPCISCSAHIVRIEGA